jgi:RNA-directed DNA polymerase
LYPTPSDEGPNREKSASSRSRGRAMHQKSRQLELALEGRGEAPRGERSGEAGRAAQGEERSGSHDLMERVVARENAVAALKRVRQNKGSPGFDGMTVGELEPYLREKWPVIREQLLAGSYRPGAVKRQLIPKSGGGMRELGIPTVLDRFVQQLLLQVLQPMFDPTFSEHSHGFRPGRRAHDAVCKAQQYIQDGRRWVVDVDLERRGHCFVRYADDCNVYVRSKRAGERVLAALRQKYAKLRLQVNEEKSAVARVWGRKFLGYSFWVAKGGVVKRRVAPKALEEMKQRVRQITGRNGGRSMEQVGRELGAYLRGWKAYFRLADTPGIFADLDGWIHRRLRCIQLKQWKRGRTAYRELTARGLPEWLVRKGAGYGRRWWWAANLGAMHTALPGSYFERLGVPRLATQTSTH